jgi:DNA-directed RNA polymerase specialized sigma24 family protein
MSSDGSVTCWLEPLKYGDRVAVEQLWRRYFSRMVNVAEQKLANAPRCMGYVEDVALSAFHSFYRIAVLGRFPELNNRDGLWRLLFVFTARKASHLRRDEAAHGGGEVVNVGGDEWLLAHVLSREPDPAIAAIAADEHRQLMEVLGDDELRDVALRRMKGESVEEIAARLRYCSRSIKRKLDLIRRTWTKELTK